MNNNLLNEFFKSTKEKGTVSDISLSIYKKDILDFNKFIDEKDFRVVTKEDVAKYINFMEEKYKKNTVIRKTSSIKSFYKFLVKKEFIDESPVGMIRMSNKKQDKSEGRKIEINELKSILDVCPLTLKGRRDKIAIILLAETGLQITEILNLKISELEEKDYSSFTVKTGNEYIIVELSEETSMNLKEYVLEYRYKLVENSEDDKVFCDLSRQNFKQRFVKYGERAGLTRRVLPHMVKKRVEYERYEILYEKKEDLLEKIRKEYFRIGIGDN